MSMDQFTASSTYSVSWHPQKPKPIKPISPRTVEAVQRQHPEIYAELLETPYVDTALELIRLTHLPVGFIDDVAKIFHYADDALDHFRTLNSTERTEMLWMMRNDLFDSWSLCVYFRARKLAGNPTPVFRTLHLGDFVAIENSVRRVGGNPDEGTFDFDSYVLYLCERERKGMLHLTTIQLLRCVFGEQKVYEMLELFDSVDLRWSNYDYVEIMKQWDNLKMHPAHWIAATVDSITDSPRSPA